MTEQMQLLLADHGMPEWAHGPHDEEAWRFHKDHPEAYEMLRGLALRGVRSGRQRLGIGQLFEVLRWERAMDHRDRDFKLNNNFRAFFARLLMEREPELRGVFETRGEA